LFCPQNLETRTKPHIFQYLVHNLLPTSNRQVVSMELYFLDNVPNLGGWIPVPKVARYPAAKVCRYRYLHLIIPIVRISRISDEIGTGIRCIFMKNIKVIVKFVSV
jgi:hypothetical protein